MDDDDITTLFERAECARRDAQSLRDRSRVLRVDSLRLLVQSFVAALESCPNAAHRVALRIRDGKVDGWEVIDQ